MERDVNKISRDALVTEVKKGVREFSIATGAAVLGAVLDRDGSPRVRATVALLLVVLVVGLFFREQALARVATARGPELDRLGGQLKSSVLSIGVIYGGAFIGIHELSTGNVTPYAIGLAVTCAVGGLLMQFKVKPTLDRAWAQLRELDSKAV